MFRVNESEEKYGFSVSERGIQAALCLALVASLASIYLAYSANPQFSSGASTPESANATTSSEVTLQNVRFLFVASLLVSFILVCCLAATWSLRRRYMTSQRFLHQLKMLAHDILASMDRGVITTNREGIITSINSAGIRLLKVDFECVGKPLTAISAPGVPLEAVYHEVVEGQAPVLDRDCNVDRAGRVLRLQVDGHVLQDTRENPLGCVIHVRNVTERMLLEERMRRMERYLSLATLASGLQHEIKNPLTALSIHIQLLEENLADGKTVDEFVGVLKTEVCRLNGVLESFRSFAHLQRLSVRPTNVVEVLENVVRLIRPQAAEQYVEVGLVEPLEELPPVPLDADKFEQAVLNLAINALEAMPEGGCLTIGASVIQGELRVTVTDTGRGILPEVQKNLFLPYFSTKATGSGLGLALSEKLVSQHGGHIDFSTGQAGTAFWIGIPLERRDGAP